VPGRIPRHGRRRSDDFVFATHSGSASALNAMPRLTHFRSGIKLVAVLCLFIGTTTGHAENGAAGWLRYAPLTGTAKAARPQLPARIVVLGTYSDADRELIVSAVKELTRGLAGMCNVHLAPAATPGDI